MQLKGEDDGRPPGEKRRLCAPRAAEVSGRAAAKREPRETRRREREREREGERERMKNSLSHVLSLCRFWLRSVV